MTRVPALQVPFLLDAGVHVVCALPGGQECKGVVVDRDDQVPPRERHGDWIVYPNKGEWPDFLEGHDMGRSLKTEELAIDMTHWTGRARAAQWYGESHPCAGCGGTGRTAAGSTCQSCNGFRNFRSCPLWHLIPNREGGKLGTSWNDATAFLVAVAVNRVIAGQDPILYVFGTWREDTLNHQWKRWMNSWSEHLTGSVHPSPLVTSNDPNHCVPGRMGRGLSDWSGDLSGPETGEKGKALADALALAKGWALLEKDGVRVTEGYFRYGG